MTDVLSDTHEAAAGSFHIAPVRVSSKVTALVEQLATQIVSGAVPAGSRLPSEREVASEAGVSRAIVREALSALSVVGLVERREGSGTYAAKPSSSPDLQTRALLLVEQDMDPLSVLAARETVEPALAPLVVRNATDEDLRKIDSGCKAMAGSLEMRDWTGFLSADRAFHHCIAAATHNPCVMSIETYLLARMFVPVWVEMKKMHLETVKDSSKAVLSAHCAVGLAACERDERQLALTMRRLFRETWRMMES